MRNVLAVVMIMGSTSTLSANICGPGARIDFPVTEIFRDEEAGYHLDAMGRSPSDGSGFGGLSTYARFYPQVLAERSAALPPELADLPYLAVLSTQLSFGDPLQMLTYTPQSTVLPQIVAALERLGLTEAAEAARVPLEVFPGWEDGLTARLEEVGRLGSSELGGARGERMRHGAERLRALGPEIAAAVEDLLGKDPTIAADYERRRLAVGDDRRIEYLVTRVVAECMAGSGWTPDEKDAAFARLAEPQRDLVLMYVFLLESYNGSIHQYFYNSSGTMAPQLAETLDRLGLPDHAAGIRKGMAVFPAPYPRDTEARRSVMAGFTEDEHEALYQLTYLADDGRILERMTKLARDTGLMPR